MTEFSYYFISNTSEYFYSWEPNPKASPLLLNTPCMRGKLLRCQACRASSSFATNEQSGDVTCTKCGRVAEERSLSDKSFTEAQGRQAHAPNTFGSQLATRIGGAAAAEGSACSSLQRTHVAAQRTSREVRQLGVVAEIRRVAVLLGAERLAQAAVALYHKSETAAAASSEVRALRSGNSGLLAAVVLNVACRVHGEPRSIREIRAVIEGDVEVRKVNALTRVMKRSLEGVPWPPLDVLMFIPRFCTLLNVPYQVQRVAAAVAASAESDRFPYNLAAAAIVVAVSDAARRRSNRGSRASALAPLRLEDVVARTRVSHKSLRKLILRIDPATCAATQRAIEEASAPLAEEAATEEEVKVAAKRASSRAFASASLQPLKRSRAAAAAPKQLPFHAGESRPGSPSPTSVLLPRVHVAGVSLSAAEISAVLD